MFVIWSMTLKYLLRLKLTASVMLDPGPLLLPPPGPGLGPPGLPKGGGGLLPGGGPRPGGGGLLPPPGGGLLPPPGPPWGGGPLCEVTSVMRTENRSQCLMSGADWAQKMSRAQACHQVWPAPSDSLHSTLEQFSSVSNQVQKVAFIKF